jgi:DnaJ-class molecular chaperone
MPDQKPNAIKLYHQCGKCEGTGKFTPPELPEGDCPGCSGVGYNVHYHIDMDGIIAKLDDIMDKVEDILDKVDT